MQSRLLLSAVLAAGAMTAGAAEFYTTDQLGEVYGISDNGRYAAITDIEGQISYIWDSENPSEFTLLDGLFRKSEAYDVSNDGMVVGGVLDYDKWKPAYTDANGDWQILPLNANFSNIGYATNVSPDGMTIVGYMSDVNPVDENKTNYPCKWTKNADGGWDLHSYNNITLPTHQGFFTTCFLQKDGKEIIGGYVFTNWGGVTNALLVDGELKIWNKMEWREGPWIYKGKYEGTDENGKQIWLDDPNDPRVNMYPEAYIDGFYEGNGGTEDMFAGGFFDCDWYGNFFGQRTQVRDVKEDGTGRLINGATIYSLKDEKFTDYNEESTDGRYSSFSTGVGTGYVFLPGDNVLVDGETESMTEKWGFAPSYAITAVMKHSENGKVLGGMTQEQNPATGEMQYCPFFLILDEPLVEISAVEKVEGEISKVGISAEPGMIRVFGASEVAVYDLNGRLVGNSAANAVAPGIYVVKADGVTRKVAVK